MYISCINIYINTAAPILVGTHKLVSNILTDPGHLRVRILASLGMASGHVSTHSHGSGSLTSALMTCLSVNLPSASYKFSHLDAWMNNGGTLSVDVDNDDKGKEKDKGKGKGKGKDEGGSKKRAHKKK